MAADLTREDITREAMALQQVERFFAILTAREPGIVEDFARFVQESRHGTFTFVRDENRVYDARSEIHARRSRKART